MKEIFTLFIYWTFSGIFMTDYKLDVIPEYASDAVINFNSHSLAGYEFQGLFNKLALLMHLVVKEYLMYTLSVITNIYIPSIVIS
jgi:hypothetical protein